MQFEMRERAYAMQFPKLEVQMIEGHDGPVGQMLTEERSDVLALVDIAILSEHQGRGLGRSVIGDLQRRAAEAGLPIVLHVDMVNTRAQALYAKMGFRVTGQSQIQYRMEWNMPMVDSTTTNG